MCVYKNDVSYIKSISNKFWMVLKIESSKHYLPTGTWHDWIVYSASVLSVKEKVKIKIKLQHKTLVEIGINCKIW